MAKFYISFHGVFSLLVDADDIDEAYQTAYDQLDAVAENCDIRDWHGYSWDNVSMRQKE